AAGEPKEPSAAAREAAKVLRADLAKFSLLVYGHGVKADPPWVRLVTNKERIKAGEKGAFVIPEGQARAGIDGLGRAGQVDKPRYVPPPGVLPPGWYLYVGIEGDRPRLYQWRLGAPNYDLSTDPAVGRLLKALDGDAKKALERLAGREAGK